MVPAPPVLMPGQPLPKSGHGRDVAGDPFEIRCVDGRLKARHRGAVPEQGLHDRIAPPQSDQVVAGPCRTAGPGCGVRLRQCDEVSQPSEFLFRKPRAQRQIAIAAKAGRGRRAYRARLRLNGSRGFARVARRWAHHRARPARWCCSTVRPISRWRTSVAPLDDVRPGAAARAGIGHRPDNSGPPRCPRRQSPGWRRANPTSSG